MVIKEGKFGSISFFYKDQYWCSCPKTRPDQYEKYIADAGKILISQLKSGYSLKNTINICEKSLKMYQTRQFIHNKKLTRKEFETVISLHFCLLRSRTLEKDLVLLEMPKKKKSSSLVRSHHQINSHL